MKVSRSSWHYRCVEWMWSAPPRPASREADEYALAEVVYAWEPVSTCDYFQKLTITGLLAVAFSPFFLIFGVLFAVDHGLQWVAQHSRWRPWQISTSEKAKRADEKYAADPPKTSCSLPNGDSTESIATVPITIKGY